MNLLRLTRPSESVLHAVLDEQAGAPLTYSEVGATQRPELPDGYTHDRYRIRLPDGTFELATRGLRAWRAHIDAGVAVFPPTAALEPGANVVLIIHTGPLYAIAACRIVYVCDEPDRFGFAYGTLPDHPEVGEEAFMVERDTANRVHFTITAFSRLGSPATRLARPFARVIQQRVTRKYLEGLREYTARPV